MSVAERFFDTNVLLYVLSADSAKAERAGKLFEAGGVVSVQVLNEFAAVATRKLGMTAAEVRETLGVIRELCRVVPLTEETHDRGMALHEQHRLSIYDAMMVASAMLAGCGILLTEDLQHGQTFERRVKVQNPFR